MITNLTPHAVTIGATTFPPSGHLARVSVSLADIGERDGIPLVTGKYGEVTGLPDESTGEFFIVSAMVRTALPDRKDLGSPAKLVRDEKGNITGCEALEVNP